MAIDEVISAQISKWRGFLMRAQKRWLKDVAHAARAPGYDWDALFEKLREQFVDNWDTWNEITGLPLSTLVPTVSIKGGHGSMRGQTGVAYVYPRLSGATFKNGDLYTFGDAQTISSADYTVQPSGSYDGLLQVKLGPATDSAARGTYRGLVMYNTGTSSYWDPLVWVVVDIS